MTGRYYKNASIIEKLGIYFEFEYKKDEKGHSFEFTKSKNPVEIKFDHENHKTKIFYSTGELYSQYDKFDSDFHELDPKTYKITHKGITYEFIEKESKLLISGNEGCTPIVHKCFVDAIIPYELQELNVFQVKGPIKALESYLFQRLYDMQVNTIDLEQSEIETFCNSFFPEKQFCKKILFPPNPIKIDPPLRDLIDQYNIEVNDNIDKVEWVEEKMQFYKERNNGDLSIEELYYRQEDDYVTQLKADWQKMCCLII